LLRGDFVPSMHPPMLRWLSLVVLISAPFPGGAAEGPAPTHDAARQPAPSEVRAVLAETDALYEQRDAPGVPERIRGRLEEAGKLAPDDYEVLWRLARIYFWMADDPALPNGEKSKLGKRAWEYGDRATRSNPARVEGWNFAAAGMGNYALGIGIFKALGEGIEGKFKERLSRAEQIDANFQNGSIQTAWGRFWFKLPWPKYDGKKSERALLAALKKNPDNVRARVYLAELYRKEGHKDAAKDQLAKAVSGEPGRYDAPEERRWQRVAREMLGK
jgi:tetratricopeptide (TPR) repeat protein